MRPSFTDIPISESDQSLLGIEPFANALAEFIKGTDTPITIGIQGDWGSGKTSLMNLVRAQIDSGRKFYTLYFNTWQYAQFDQEREMSLALLQGLHAELARSLGKRANKKVGEALKRFGSFVANVGNQLLSARVGLDVQAALESSEDTVVEQNAAQLIRDLRERFQDVVRSLGRRLVLFIDDLDRVRPIKALELLESMKNFLDVEGCIFVLAVDYAVVQRGMIEKLGASVQDLHGKSYFDKIIQVPFQMPVSGYRLDKYLMGLLGCEEQADGTWRSVDRAGLNTLLTGTKIQKLERDDVKFFTNIVRLTAGANPRSIKRIVNYATLLRGVVTESRTVGQGRTAISLDEVKLLFALAALQLTWPEVFEYFVRYPSPEVLMQLEDWEYLKDTPRFQPILRRARDPEETLSHISGFFDELIHFLDRPKGGKRAGEGDGRVDLEEISLLWGVMEDANLTAVSISRMRDQWTLVVERVRAAVAGARSRRDEAYYERLLRILEGTRLCHPAHVRILEAGARFVNVLWDGHQVACIVSTQGDPLRIYLRAPLDAITEHLSENKDNLQAMLSDATKEPHYGTGRTKVELSKLFPPEESLTEQKVRQRFDALFRANVAACGLT